MLENKLFLREEFEALVFNLAGWPLRRLAASALVPEDAPLTKTAPVLELQPDDYHNVVYARKTRFLLPLTARACQY